MGTHLAMDSYGEWCFSSWDYHSTVFHCKISVRVKIYTEFRAWCYINLFFVLSVEMTFYCTFFIIYTRPVQNFAHELASTSPSSHWETERKQKRIDARITRQSFILFVSSLFFLCLFFLFSLCLAQWNNEKVKCLAREQSFG